MMLGLGLKGTLLAMDRAFVLKLKALALPSAALDTYSLGPFASAIFRYFL